MTIHAEIKILKDTLARLEAKVAAESRNCEALPGSDSMPWSKEADIVNSWGEKLLPCPWCGEEAALESDSGHHWVQCTNLESCGRTDECNYNSVGEAEAAWNQRAHYHQRDESDAFIAGWQACAASKGKP